MSQIDIDLPTRDREVSIGFVDVDTGEPIPGATLDVTSPLPRASIPTRYRADESGEVVFQISRDRPRTRLSVGTHHPAYESSYSRLDLNEDRIELQMAPVGRGVPVTLLDGASSSPCVLEIDVVSEGGRAGSHRTEPMFDRPLPPTLGTGVFALRLRDAGNDAVLWADTVHVRSLASDPIVIQDVWLPRLVHVSGLPAEKFRRVSLQIRQSEGARRVVATQWLSTNRPEVVALPSDNGFEVRVGGRLRPGIGVLPRALDVPADNSDVHVRFGSGAIKLGCVTPSDEPLFGIELEVVADATAEAIKLVTDRTGFVHIVGVPPGGYHSYVHGLPWTEDLIRSFGVEQDTVAEVVHILEAGTSEIRGSVEPGKDISLVKVRRIKPPGGGAAEATVDAEGHFRISGLIAGAYTLSGYHWRDGSFVPLEFASQTVDVPEDSVCEIRLR